VKKKRRTYRRKNPKWCRFSGIALCWAWANKQDRYCWKQLDGKKCEHNKER